MQASITASLTFLDLLLILSFFGKLVSSLQGAPEDTVEMIGHGDLKSSGAGHRNCHQTFTNLESTKLFATI